MFMNNLIALLCYILPNSARNLGLALSHLSLSGVHFDRLVTSLSLRAATLSHVRLGAARAARRARPAADPGHELACVRDRA
jgi:hypothetical protein